MLPGATLTRWTDWEPIAVREGDGAVMVRTGLDAEGREVGVIVVEGLPLHEPMSIGGMLRMSNRVVWTPVPGASLPGPVEPSPKPRWPTRHRRRRGP